MAATEPVTPRRIRAIGDSGLARRGGLAPQRRSAERGSTDLLTASVRLFQRVRRRSCDSRRVSRSRSPARWVRTFDDRLQVGLEQAGQVLELGGQL